MKVRLKNHQPKILGLVTGHKLMPRSPGHNTQDFEMTDEQFKKLIKNEQFRSWCKMGWCALLQEAPGKSAPEEVAPELLLDKHGTRAAKDLVRGENSVELLTAWHEREPRRTVQKVIADRLAELAEPASPAELEPDEGFDEVFGGEE